MLYIIVWTYMPLDGPTITSVSLEILICIENTRFCLLPLKLILETLQVLMKSKEQNPLCPCRGAHEIMDNKEP